jgi:Transcriptional regulatory protein, C terminal
VDFDTGLNTTIKRLRETLGDSADNPIFIETVPRRGYRFIAPVSESGSVPLSSPQRIEVAAKNKVRTGFRLGLAVALTVLLVAFSFKRVSVSGAPPERMLSFAQLTMGKQKWGLFSQMFHASISLKSYRPDGFWHKCRLGVDKQFPFRLL